MWNPLGALFERRSWSPEVIDFLTRGARSVAGTSVTETTAFNVGAVWTAVSLIARAVASLPMRVIERLPDDQGRRQDRTHPINAVLRQPNSWQSRQEFLQMQQTHLLLRGNAYAWKNVVRMTRKGPQIRELIPLHPDRVEVEQDDDDLSIKYTLHRKQGGAVPIPQEEMLHLRGLTTDGVLGRSPLRDAREIIGIALATQAHAGHFWANDATPTIVLSHPSKLSDQAQVNLETSWAKTYGQAPDKRKVAVIEEGMKIEQLSLTAEDAQFLQTRKFQRAEIGSWWHVPPHLMGDTEKSTSWGTGSEQQTIGFLTYTILPWLVAWEQRMALDLLDDPERYAIQFVVDGFRRGDLKSQYAALGTGIDKGFLSPNDARAFLDMNPIDGGDTYLVPQNMAPIELLADLLAAKVGTSTESEAE